MKLALTWEDLRAMEEAAIRSHPLDAAVVFLLTRTGARVSEVASLRRDAILETPQGDFVRLALLKQRAYSECPRCHTRTGKLARFCPKCGGRVRRVVGERKRERLVPLAEDTVRVLREYLEWRNSQRKYQRSPWMFPSPRNPLQHISRQAITNSIVYPVARDAGLGGRCIALSTDRGISLHQVSPHRIRDAVATNYLFRSGVNDRTLRELQEFLGHQRIETTAKYAKAVDISRVAQAIARGA